MMKLCKLEALSGLYMSAAMLACFDGDAGAGDAGAGDAGADDTKTKEKTPRTFTQAEVDVLMEKHRKGLQSKIAELETILQDKNPTALEEKVNELSLSLKTKEEQAKIEQEKLRTQSARELEKLTKERDQFRNQLHENVIQTQLTRAATEGDAFNADQVVTLLRGYTSLTDDNKVVVKGLHTLEDGSPSSFTPAEAVKWMRDQIDKYGNLFKANVVGGIGGHSAAGGARAGKPVDVRSLSPAEYRRMKKENPKALGFGN